MALRSPDPFQTLSDCEDWTNRLLEMDDHTGFSRSAPMANSEKPENLNPAYRPKAWGTYLFLVVVATALYLITQPLLNSPVTSTRWLTGLTVAVLVMTLGVGWVSEQNWQKTSKIRHSRRDQNTKTSSHRTPVSNHAAQNAWRELSNLLES